ncbi:TSCPD domain-containing protein [Spirochaetia bacterium]|nr:TSCPD domain-containing protein [Spirochaetia bacterium]
MYEYTTAGTCSSKIRFDIQDNKVRNLSFVGGCDGNLKGISLMAEGMDAQQLSEQLKGVRCGSKETSCPDQLARALSLVLKEQAKKN